MFEKTRYLIVLMALVFMLTVPVVAYAADEVPPTPEPGGRIIAPGITGVNPDPEPEEGQLSEIEASGSVQQQAVGVPVSSEAPPLMDIALNSGNEIPEMASSLGVPMRYQETVDVSCGVQALGMAMDYLALGEGQEAAPKSEELLTALSDGGLLYEWGTGVEELAYLARQQGYAGSYSFHDWTLGQVREQLDQGRPVVVSLGTNGEGEPGHFVTVTGISEDGQWVSYNDPVEGKMTVPVGEFLVEWSWQGYAGMVTQREALATEADPMLPVMGMFSALSALTVMASQQPWRRDVVAKVTAMQDVLADPERVGIGGRRRRRRRPRRRRRRPRRRVRARRPRRVPRRPPKRRRVVRSRSRGSATRRRAAARSRAAAQARARAQAKAQRKEQMARQAAMLKAKREAEAKHRAAEAKRMAALAAKYKAEQEARRKAALEVQRKEQMARQAALLKARREAEADARRKASLEAKLKAEREARLKAAEEAAKKAKAQQEANSASQVELLRYRRNAPPTQSLADWRQQDVAVADQQVNIRREAETATQVELLRNQRNRSQQQRLADWKQQDMAEVTRQQQVSSPSFWSSPTEWLQAKLIKAGRKNENVKEILVSAGNATNTFNQTIGQPIRDMFDNGSQAYGNWASNPNRPLDLLNPNWWRQRVINPVQNYVDQKLLQPVRQAYTNWVLNPNRPLDLLNRNWWQKKVVEPVVDVWYGSRTSMSPPKNLSGQLWLDGITKAQLLSPHQHQLDGTESTPNDCNTTSMAMVVNQVLNILGYSGNPAQHGELAILLDSHPFRFRIPAGFTDAEGVMPPGGVVHALNIFALELQRYGYPKTWTAESTGRNTVNDLISNLQNGYPTIIFGVWENKPIYPLAEGDPPHAMVVAGYDASKDKWMILDPGHPLPFNPSNPPEFRKMTTTELEEWWGRRFPLWQRYTMVTVKVDK
ncbi:MAG: C39 family peptidase [Anaerolineales bacterium]|nr:C39 family peptidase [Anaerolineales bacterium]